MLYRLQFILFAEARELLPVEASGAYRERYSLAAIKREVAKDLKDGPALPPSTVTLWPHLTELFDFINRGSPPFKVATFNGGLFDPERHPFLEECAVGDFRLQQAIDKLARVAGEFVDYRDLSERQLGTIYEGLLEFQLRPLAASQPDIENDPAGGLRPGVLADAGVTEYGKEQVWILSCKARKMKVSRHRISWRGESMGYMVDSRVDNFFLYGTWESANHPSEIELRALLREGTDQIVMVESENTIRALLIFEPEDTIEVRIGCDDE